MKGAEAAALEEAPPPVFSGASGSSGASVRCYIS